MIYVMEDKPAKEPIFVNISRDIKSIFVKESLLNCGWLLFGSCYPPRQQDKYFFNQLGKVLDKYTQKYGKFLSPYR